MFASIIQIAAPSSNQTDPMLTEVPFYYLRHGQTDWNRDGRFQGWTDVPLNATGRAQAEAAAALVRDLGIRTICASPLSRALDTARTVAAAVGRPVEVIDDLRECGFGVQEGAEMGEWYAAWRAGTTPEGAETYRGFLDRALGGVNRALAAQDGPVLIVAHGGVYWAIRDHARLEQQSIPNCQPLFHEPPRPDRPWWQRAVIGE
jgi:probable phosphoglycerate mutase